MSTVVGWPRRSSEPSASNQPPPISRLLGAAKTPLASAYRQATRRVADHSPQPAFGRGGRDSVSSPREPEASVGGGGFAGKAKAEGAVQTPLASAYRQATGRVADHSPKRPSAEEGETRSPPLASPKRVLGEVVSPVKRKRRGRCRPPSLRPIGKQPGGLPTTPPNGLRPRRERLGLLPSRAGGRLGEVAAPSRRRRTGCWSPPGVGW